MENDDLYKRLLHYCIINYVICFMNRIIIVLLLLIPGMSRSQNLSFDGTNDYVSTANTSETD